VVTEQTDPVDERAAVAVDSVRDVAGLAFNREAAPGLAAKRTNVHFCEGRAVLQAAALDLDVIDDLEAVDEDIQR